jgi:undecaprenyl-diphosphatase
MEIIQALILGIIQGITEWLPVSSSGHLVLLQQLFGLGANVAFDALLHIATIIVIFMVFWKDILAIVKSFFSFKWDENTKLLLFIIIATIPTALMGLVFQDFFKALFTNMLLLGVFFIINGLILFLTRFIKVKNKALNWWQSFIIGVAQGASIIPSISRSGATVSTGLFFGIKRQTLIKFSFLMAIPAIIGAFILEFNGLSFENPLALILGSLAALIVGYFSLKLIIRTIEKGKWYVFAYYCFALGIIILALSNI